METRLGIAELLSGTPGETLPPIALPRDRRSDHLFPRRLTVEPTLYCDVGCSFCKYAPPRQPAGEKDPDLVLSDESIDAIIAFSHETDLSELVITGGGEPTHELDKVLALITNSDVERIWLYTAVQWAQSVDDAAAFLVLLDHAASSAAVSELVVRLSVDRYHANRISTLPIRTVLRAIERSGGETTKIRIAIRTVFGDQDLVSEVLESLGGSVTWNQPDRSTGTGLISGHVIPIHAAGLVPTGRLSTTKLRRTTGPEPDFLHRYYAASLGPGWPVLYEGGWNVGVRPSGHVYLYGGAPADYGRLPHVDVATAVERISERPVNRAIAELGFQWFISTLLSIGISSERIFMDWQEPSVIAPRALANLRLRFLADLLALNDLEASGLLPPGDAHRMVEFALDIIQLSPDWAADVRAIARSALDEASAESSDVRVALGLTLKRAIGDDF